MRGVGCRTVSARGGSSSFCCARMQSFLLQPCPQDKTHPLISTPSIHSSLSPNIHEHTHPLSCPDTESACARSTLDRMQHAANQTPTPPGAGLPLTQCNGGSPCHSTSLSPQPDSAADRVQLRQMCTHSHWRTGSKSCRPTRTPHRCVTNTSPLLQVNCSAQ